MVRMYVMKVLNGHIQNLTNNLQNVKTKKEKLHRILPVVKYAPFSDKRQGKITDYDQNSSHRLTAFSL